MGEVGSRADISPNLYLPFNPFSPWGRWTPWYNGYGWGYVSYDPWRYGSSRWNWNRYGYYYNPYDPFCYGYRGCDPWGYGYSYGGSYGGGGGGSTAPREDEMETGSIRLKASPRSAEVLVDGALTGTVDDFDGLTNHLKLKAGVHQIEIRAPGFVTYTSDVTVKAGKTLTHRASLKKQ